MLKVILLVLGVCSAHAESLRDFLGAYQTHQGGYLRVIFRESLDYPNAYELVHWGKEGELSKELVEFDLNKMLRLPLKKKKEVLLVSYHLEGDSTVVQKQEIEVDGGASRRIIFPHAERRYEFKTNENGQKLLTLQDRGTSFARRLIGRDMKVLRACELAFVDVPEDSGYFGRLHRNVGEVTVRRVHKN